MELTEILNIVFGSTSVVAVAAWFYFRKENKRLKQNEVKVSDVDTQRQQIELVELYKDKVLQLLDQVSEKQDTGNANQVRMLEKLSALDSRMDDVERYLNGPYHEWLAEQQAGKGAQ